MRLSIILTWSVVWWPPAQKRMGNVLMFSRARERRWGSAASPLHSEGGRRGRAPRPSRSPGAARPTSTTARAGRRFRDVRRPPVEKPAEIWWISGGQRARPRHRSRTSEGLLPVNPVVRSDRRRPCRRFPFCTHDFAPHAAPLQAGQQKSSWRRKLGPTAPSDFGTFETCRL